MRQSIKSAHRSCGSSIECSHTGSVGEVSIVLLAVLASLVGLGVIFICARKNTESSKKPRRRKWDIDEHVDRMNARKSVNQREGMYFDRVLNKWVEDIDFGVRESVIRITNPTPDALPRIPYDEATTTDIPIDKLQAYLNHQYAMYQQQLFFQQQQRMQQIQQINVQRAQIAGHMQRVMASVPSSPGLPARSDHQQIASQLRVCASQHAPAVFKVQ